MQQQKQKHQQEAQRVDTARECAKDCLRSYFGVDETIGAREVARHQVCVTHSSYEAQIGPTKALPQVSRAQIAVTRVGDTPCRSIFNLDDIVAEIRDEDRGFYQQPLDVFELEQQKAAEQLRQEAEEREQATNKQPAVYRSYYAGNCLNCGKPLGFIEVNGGRDRLYCPNRGKCKQAYHRKKEKEEKREQILQYNSELREYWKTKGIHGEVLLRLHEILFQHGKKAAKAATDTVLVALEAAERAGTDEQNRLIEEIMLEGETIGYEELRLEDFRIDAGVEGWSEFVSHASTGFLRQVRGYLYDRQHREAYKAKARQRLEMLSCQAQEEEQQLPVPQRSTGQA
jgi:hypothetical protein